MGEPSEFFLELFRDLPQQGPGSDGSTERALTFLTDLPADPRILDVGCGSGRQSLVLARRTGGTVAAVDVLDELLATLDQQASAEGLGGRIETHRMSMDELDFPSESFDLIWSEGAIYNMGFQKGLEAWRPLVRPRGVIGVSELTWLSDLRPEPVVEFLTAAYPTMGSLEENRSRTVEAGYRPLGGFVLPDEDWWNDYYAVLESRILDQQPAATDPEHLEVLAQTQTEIDLFRARRGSYGYVFYLMRKED